MSSRLLARSVAGLLLAGFLLVPTVRGADLSLGEALEGAFKPSREIKRHPEYRKPGEKGIVQRSHVNPDLQKNIQIAFVLDATMTMRRDLQALKDKLNLVVELMKGRVTSAEDERQVFVEVAVVVYRDLLRSHKEPLELREPVEILTGDAYQGFYDFNRDSARLLKLLDSLEVQPGDPGFEEQVDRGLHAALTELGWDTSNDVSRIIFLAGDAPPWDEKYLQPAAQPEWRGWREAGPPTLRGHGTASLIEVANAAKISVFSIACKTTSAEATVKAQTEARNTFFRKLAEGTGGQFMNLFDPATAETLAEATKGEPARFLELKQISREEYDERMVERQCRVAVLPPLPFDAMKFDDELQTSVIAAETVLRLQEISGDGVLSMRAVRAAWDRQTGGGSPAGLMGNLEADILIAGRLETEGDSSTLVFEAYDGTGHSLAVTGRAEGSPANLVSAALGSLAADMQRAAAGDSSPAGCFARVFGERLAEGAQPPLAANPAAHDDLVRGWERLEQAMQYESGQDGGTMLLGQAVERLKAALEQEPENPLALMLLANCYSSLGMTEDAKAQLELAMQHRDRAGDTALRSEIEADHALFVAQDPAEAIRIYQTIAENGAQGQSRSRLRALWMLAGLYLGDWGADKAAESLGMSELERLDAARSAVLDIVAGWPQSPEARYYARYINPPMRGLPQAGGLATNEPVRVLHNLIVPLSGRARLATVASDGSRTPPGG